MADQIDPIEEIYSKEVSSLRCSGYEIYVHQPTCVGRVNNELEDQADILEEICLELIHSLSYVLYLPTIIGNLQVNVRID